MNSSEYAQTLEITDKWQEWVEFGKDVSAAINLDQGEVFLTGRVEFNEEIDSFSVIGMYATDRDGDEVAIEGFDRAQATANMINKYFEEVGL